MRSIGQLDSSDHARLFSDYLTSQGIENQVDEDPAGVFGIWVYSDDQLDQASRLLGAFKADPTRPEYRKAAGASDELHKKQEMEAKKAQEQFIDIRTNWSPPGQNRLGPVTLVLMGTAILISLYSRLGSSLDPVHFLFMTNFTTEDGYLTYQRFLPEITSGQVWRLFTPIFLHFGFFHILFNMLWLKDLGGLIEIRHGSAYMLAMVLVIAALSNTAQFFLTGPLFGGMSGVVYGFLGYLWIRGRFDPFYGQYLHRDTVILMIIWFVLGFTSLLPGMANTVHGVGLLTGMVWGYVSSGHWKRSLRR